MFASSYFIRWSSNYFETHQPNFWHHNTLLTEFNQNWTERNTNATAQRHQCAATSFFLSIHSYQRFVPGSYVNKLINFPFHPTTQKSGTTLHPPKPRWVTHFSCDWQLSWNESYRRLTVIPLLTVTAALFSYYDGFIITSTVWPPASKNFEASVRAW